MEEKLHNWNKEKILKLYQRPLLELVYKTAGIHHQYHDPSVI